MAAASADGAPRLFAASGWTIRMDLLLDALTGHDVFPPKCLAHVLPRSCLPGLPLRAGAGRVTADTWVPPTEYNARAAWRTRLWMRLGPTGCCVRAPADGGAHETLFIRTPELREDIVCVGYFEFPGAVSAAEADASSAPRFAGGGALLTTLDPSRPAEFFARLRHAHPDAFAAPPWMLGLTGEEVAKMQAV